MGVSDDEALVVKRLGSRKVGLLSVGEDTSVEVGDVQLRIKGLISSDVSAILGEEVFGGRHMVDGWNQADGRRVARTSGDLGAVGEGGLREREGAEVDVVAVAKSDWDISDTISALTSCWWTTHSGRRPGGSAHRQ